MLAQAVRLARMAALLEVPVFATEQNPDKLGSTVPELQAALAAIDVAMRSIDIFGEAPTPPPPRPISSGGDIVMF